MRAVRKITRVSFAIDQIHKPDFYRLGLSKKSEVAELPLHVIG